VTHLCRIAATRLTPAGVRRLREPTLRQTKLSRLNGTALLCVLDGVAVSGLWIQASYLPAPVNGHQCDSCSVPPKQMGLLA